jgi:death-on-curing protein
MLQKRSWAACRAALSAHAEQIEEHGGAAGIGDTGLFKGAMARPQQPEPCGDPDAPALAAAYALGLARNHPLVDGNKSTATVVSLLFLLRNGLRIAASDADMAVTFIALAAQEFSQGELADWFRQSVVAAG